MHNILNLIDKQSRLRGARAISRRGMLKGGAMALAGGALAADAVFAAVPARADTAKVSKESVAYQSSPKGNNRCELCLQFEPPSACKLVEGGVSPMGSCNLFAAKK